MRRRNNMMIAAFVAAGLYAGLGLIALGHEGPANAAEPSASDCVTILRAEKAQALDMNVTNACGRGLACELRWTLTCESMDGKVTARTPKASRFTIDAAGQSQVTASASVCKDSWTVTDVTWSCAGR